MQTATATVGDLADDVTPPSLEEWETEVGPSIIEVDCEHPDAPCATQLQPDYDDPAIGTAVSQYRCDHIDHLPCKPTPYDADLYNCTEDMLCNMCTTDSQYCVGSDWATVPTASITATYQGAPTLAHTGTGMDIAITGVLLLVLGVLFHIVAKYLVGRFA